MNITEIEAIDDLINNLSFNGAFSLIEENFGYNLQLLSRSYEKNMKGFNKSIDLVFFQFISILKKNEQQNHEEYINYFNYRLNKKLVSINIYAGQDYNFYLFLKNKHSL